jgi:hypothetical protein
VSSAGESGASELTEQIRSVVSRRHGPLSSESHHPSILPRTHRFRRGHLIIAAILILLGSGMIAGIASWRYRAESESRAVLQVKLEAAQAVKSERAHSENPAALAALEKEAANRLAWAEAAERDRKELDAAGNDADKLRAFVSRCKNTSCPLEQEAASRLVQRLLPAPLPSPLPSAPSEPPQQCVKSSRSPDAESFCASSPADSRIVPESSSVIPKSKAVAAPEAQNPKLQDRVSPEAKPPIANQATPEAQKSQRPIRLVAEPVARPSFSQIIAFLLILGFGVAWVWIAWSRKNSRRALDVSSATKAVSSNSIPAPQVFVSYSRQDAHTVEKLVRQIEELGYGIWIDRQLSGSQRYAAPIVQALRISRLVALMCSRNAFASDHVIREIYLAGDYKKPFIAFQLDSTTEFPDEVHYFLSGFPRLPVASMDQQQLRAEIARFVSTPSLSAAT